MTDYRAGKRARQPTHPGALLREDVLPALGITVSDAAAKLGISRQSLHAVLAERSGITVEWGIHLTGARRTMPPWTVHRRAFGRARRLGACSCPELCELLCLASSNGMSVNPIYSPPTA